MGIQKVHRDTFHAELGSGRYLLARTWHEVLTGNKAIKPFDKFDVEVSKEDIRIADSL